MTGIAYPTKRLTWTWHRRARPLVWSEPGWDIWRSPLITWLNKTVAAVKTLRFLGPKSPKTRSSPLKDPERSTNKDSILKKAQHKTSCFRSGRSTIAPLWKPLQVTVAQAINTQICPTLLMSMLLESIYTKLFWEFDHLIWTTASQ